MPNQAAVDEDIDYTAYKDRKPTPLQARFPDWIIEKTGIEFSTNKEVAAFREGVRLAVALRIPFQASPENKEATEAARKERAAAAAAQAQTNEAPAAPAQAPTTRRGGRRAAATETSAAPVAEQSAPAVPARGRRRAAASQAAF